MVSAEVSGTPELLSRNSRTCARPSSKCESWKPSHSSTFCFATMHILEGAYWCTVSSNVTCCMRHSLVAPDLISDVHGTSSITFIFNRIFLQVIFFLKANILLFIYLFLLHGVLVAVGRFFSSCSKRGLLPSYSMRASHCSGLSCCGAQDPGHWAR